MLRDLPVQTDDSKLFHAHEVVIGRQGWLSDTWNRWSCCGRRAQTAAALRELLRTDWL